MIKKPKNSEIPKVTAEIKNPKKNLYKKEIIKSSKIIKITAMNSENFNSNKKVLFFLLLINL